MSLSTMMKCAGTLLATGLLHASGSHAAEPPQEYWVASHALDCVLDNLDAYLDASEKDPLLIFMDICPTLTPSAERVLANASNSLPQIKRSAGEPAIANVLVARRYELRCLQRMREQGVLPTPEQRGTPPTLATRLSFNNCTPPAKRASQAK
jgi:hypothetical protein